MTTRWIAFWFLAAAASGQTVDYVLTAAPGTATVAPGVVIPALLYNSQLPGPVVSLTQGQTLRVRFVNGLPAASPLELPPYGTVGIDAPYLLGGAVAGVSQNAVVGYAIPNAPVLSGLRIGVQALTFVPLAPGVLLSTWQPITIH